MTVGRLLAVLVCIAAVSAAHAQPPLALTGGKRITFRDSSAAGHDSAKVIFARDPALLTLVDPTCATSSAGASLRFSTDLQTNPSVQLPCENWSVAGGGLPLLGQDRRARRRAEGPLQARQAGHQGEGRRLRACRPRTGGLRRSPLRVGAQSLCGRFTTFSRNDAAQVSGKGPSTGCQVVCGDAIPEGDEACDDGNAVNGDGCDTNCTRDRLRQRHPDAGEACDDGNLVDGDGCDANCTLTGCGNGIQSPQRAVRRRQPRQRRRLRHQLHADRLRQRRADRRRRAATTATRPPATAAAATARPESAATASLDPSEQCDDGNLARRRLLLGGCGLENGQPCSDGDFCTSDDVCVAGACVGDSDRAVDQRVRLR